MDLLSSNPIPVENFYIIYNVNERKRVRRDWVFTQAGRAALGKTQSLPPLFLSLYHCNDWSLVFFPCPRFVILEEPKCPRIL